MSIKVIKDIESNQSEKNNDKIIVDSQIESIQGDVWIDGNIYTDSGNNDNYIINSEKDSIIETQNGGIDSVSSIVSYSLNNYVVCRLGFNPTKTKSKNLVNAA